MHRVPLPLAAGQPRWPPVPSGAVAWEGKSLLDSKPVVVLVTGLSRPSANRGTGPMVQTWVLRRDVPPTEAVQTGADASVCGDCSFRRGACYVAVHQA